jgi:hypothetical protein
MTCILGLPESQLLYLSDNNPPFCGKPKNNDS